MLFNDLLDGDGRELKTVTLEEFGHEFDPVKTESMKEAFHDIHDHKDTEGGTDEDKEANEHEEDISRFKAWNHSTIIEDLGELRVSKRESPETQVRGSVGDSSENVLNNLDDLMDHDLHETFVAMMGVSINV